MQTSKIEILDNTRLHEEFSAYNTRSQLPEFILQKHVCKPNTDHHNTQVVMVVQKNSHHMQQWSKKMQLLTERKMSLSNQIKVPPTQDQEFERLISPLN